MASHDRRRFLKYVSLEGTHIPGMMLCCWDWIGAVANGNRPWFYLGGSGRLARRALFEILMDKKLPTKSAVVALCGHRLCVRPEHLFCAITPTPRRLAQTVEFVLVWGL
jgi:hypothetical protein